MFVVESNGFTPQQGAPEGYTRKSRDQRPQAGQKELASRHWRGLCPHRRRGSRAHRHAASRAHTADHTPERAGFAGSYESVVEGCQPAYLGAPFTPFELKVPMAEGQAKAKKKRKPSDEPQNPLIADLEPSVPQARLDGRLDLLEQLDQFDRKMDTDEALRSVDVQYAR